DVVLPSMHLVAIVFAETEQRAALERRQSKPPSADRARCREHLSQQRLAVATGAIKTGRAHHRDPVSNQPRTRRNTDAVEHRRIKWYERLSWRVFIAAAAVGRVPRFDLFVAGKVAHATRFGCRGCNSPSAKARRTILLRSA